MVIVLYVCNKNMGKDVPTRGMHWRVVVGVWFAYGMHVAEVGCMQR